MALSLARTENARPDPAPEQQKTEGSLARLFRARSQEQVPRPVFRSSRGIFERSLRA